MQGVRTLRVLTAVFASLNLCGASPSTCALYPFSTMPQSACMLAMLFKAWAADH